MQPVFPHRSPGVILLSYCGNCTDHQICHCEEAQPTWRPEREARGSALGVQSREGTTSPYRPPLKRYAPIASVAALTAQPLADAIGSHHFSITGTSRKCRSPTMAHIKESRTANRPGYRCSVGADQYMPPMPPALAAAAAAASAAGSGLSATMDSVVRTQAPMDAAFSSAVRVTFVGSTIPAGIMSQ